jgi:hypothetical protein
MCLAAGVMWGYSRRLLDMAERDRRFCTGPDALLAEDQASRVGQPGSGRSRLERPTSDSRGYGRLAVARIDHRCAM